MIRVCTIGKTKNAELRSLINEFLGRIKHFSRIEYEETTKQGMINSMNKNKVIIACEVNGKQYSSEEFASFLKKIEMDDVCFYIGDENGLPKEVKEKARVQLSFSKFTFPHELARVMLLEQIYRGLSITKGLPYHK